MPLAQRVPSVGSLLARIEELETKVAALMLAQRHTAESMEVLLTAIDQPEQSVPQSLDD